MYSRFLILHKAIVLFRRLSIVQGPLRELIKSRVLRNGFFGHPEVTNVGLLTLLYAGTASLFSSKYSLLNDIVKKLEQRSKSAGNILNIKNGTSETLRNEIAVNSVGETNINRTCLHQEQVKFISDHVPKHLKPLNNEQLGYYLAGLIDGDGHFSKALKLVLVFSSSDAFLAYYIKERLGYGNVKKVKDKNAYILIISNKEGMLHVINLINGKLRTEHRFNQVLNNILSQTRYKDLNLNFTIDTSNNFDNHWLAGFSDADASFQIKIIKRIANRNKPEIRLNYQIDQKSDLLLIKIKEFLGGNIGYRKSQDTYYYGSTSFGSARKVIQYFDQYHLQSRKYISYLKWRKVYRLIQDKEHLTEKGIAKILVIKSLINRHLPLESYLIASLPTAI